MKLKVLKNISEYGYGNHKFTVNSGSYVALEESDADRLLDDFPDVFEVMPENFVQVLSTFRNIHKHEEIFLRHSEHDKIKEILSSDEKEEEVKKPGRPAKN